MTTETFIEQHWRTLTLSDKARFIAGNGGATKQETLDIAKRLAWLEHGNTQVKQ